MRIDHEGDTYEVTDPDAIEMLPRYFKKGLTRRETRIAFIRLANAAAAVKEWRGDHRGVVLGWDKTP